MSIKTYLDELEKLNSEIQLNSRRNRELRNRVKQVENLIKDFLNTKEQQGLKYNGKAIVLENKEMHVSRPKKEKEKEMMEYLHSLGLRDCNSVYNKLMNIQKGDVFECQKLKVKKLDK